MLAESLAWLLTPASIAARRSGHLAESIAIVARERRCRAAWRLHLAASREALLASANEAGSWRVALLLGSGPLLDVPLAELSRMFERVWLVDVVHPWRSRIQVRRHANVRLIEHDLTEDACAVSSRFLDEERIDWVASVNLLSQLPNFTAQDHGRQRMIEHLVYLRRFRAPVCLLTDVEQLTLDAAGEVVERTDFRPLLDGWNAVAEWRWDVAPPGELDGGLSRYHRVAALVRAG